MYGTYYKKGYNKGYHEGYCEGYMRGIKKLQDYISKSSSPEKIYIQVSKEEFERLKSSIMEGVEK